jgi:hypothetical protein
MFVNPRISMTARQMIEGSEGVGHTGEADLGELIDEPADAHDRSKSPNLDELPYFCAEVLPRLARLGLRQKWGRFA